MSPIPQPQMWSIMLPTLPELVIVAAFAVCVDVCVLVWSLVLSFVGFAVWVSANAAGAIAPATAKVVAIRPRNIDVFIFDGKKIVSYLRNNIACYLFCLWVSSTSLFSKCDIYILVYCVYILHGCCEILSHLMTSLSEAEAKAILALMPI